LKKSSSFLDEDEQWDMAKSSKATPRCASSLAIRGRPYRALDVVAVVARRRRKIVARYNLWMRQDQHQWRHEPD
jgi:hypothetical protein